MIKFLNHPSSVTALKLKVKFEILSFGPIKVSCIIINLI